jgi:hypothetical protein
MTVTYLNKEVYKDNDDFKKRELITRIGDVVVSGETGILTNSFVSSERGFEGMLSCQAE